MDEFVLPIDKSKFRSTNSVWNDLALNDPWSVGYVSKLIEERLFQTKEEWEQHYYESGEKRQKELSQMSSEYRNLLNDFLLKLKNPSKITQISYELRKLNTDYGRTKLDFMEKAKVLHEAIKQNLSIDECFECVRFRTICETWNGIIYRERNTIDKLKNMFPKIDFRKVTGEKDYKYAVDYELFLSEMLLGGIQIKPKSYLGHAPYIQKAKRANSKKHLEYRNDFGRNIRFVISDMKGNILNEDDFLYRLKNHYERHT